MPLRVLSALSKSAQKFSKRAENQEFYEFGPFRVDERRGVLLKDGQPIPLTPKAFELLLLLIRGGGDTAEKSELMRRLWPDSFVEEGNLTQTVFVLRKALGDDSQDPRYIVTVPRRGYRLATQVRVASASATRRSFL